MTFLIYLYDVPYLFMTFIIYLHSSFTYTTFPIYLYDVPHLLI